jgi:hypothetical protein
VRLVLIESPFAGSSLFWPLKRLQQWLNVRYAKACVRDSLNRGEAPLASHLLYTRAGILNDDVPVERKWGIDAGLAWRRVAEASVVYIDRGISGGMRYGIDAATKAGRPVEYRRLHGPKEKRPLVA